MVRRIVLRRRWRFIDNLCNDPYWAITVGVLIDPAANEPGNYFVWRSAWCSTDLM